MEKIERMVKEEDLHDSEDHEGTSLENNYQGKKTETDCLARL